MRVLFSWRRFVAGFLAVAAICVASVLCGPGVVAWMRNRPAPDFDQPHSPLAERSPETLVPLPHAHREGELVGPAVVSQAAALGIDAAIPQPPPLAPVAAFQPLVPNAVRPEPAPIDATTIERLQAIRQRLEELGADYVIVETTDGSGLYRFHCRMLVEDQSRLTKPFESIDPDPLAAGEAVLRQVESWRGGGVAGTPSAQTRLE
jgi:hypothetical protein